jgi:hypothetical protein
MIAMFVTSKKSALTASFAEAPLVAPAPRPACGLRPGPAWPTLMELPNGT